MVSPITLSPSAVQALGGLSGARGEDRYSPYLSLPGEGKEKVQFCLRGPKCYRNMGKVKVSFD